MTELPTHPERRHLGDRRQDVNTAGIWELIDQNSNKHDSAHRRLRQDLRELEQRMDDGLKLLAEKQSAINERITGIANTPIDVTKILFAPKIVVSIVVFCLTVVGGIWATSAGLRSDVRDILTRMATEQRVADANAKLLDVNNTTVNRALENNTRELKDALASVTKRQDLLTLQYQQLSEQMTRLTAQKEK